MLSFSPTSVSDSAYVCARVSHSVVTNQLFATPWTVACQAPLAMKFSRQEYWSGLLFPSPVDLSNPGIESGSSALQADSLPSLSHHGIYNLRSLPTTSPCLIFFTLCILKKRGNAKFLDCHLFLIFCKCRFMWSSGKGKKGQVDSPCLQIFEQYFPLEFTTFLSLIVSV